MKFKIGILDDEADTIRAFKRDVAADFDVVVLELKDSISEIISDIIDTGIKALVVDFDLQKNEYNGVEVIEALKEVMVDFPTFVLTAFDEQAENNIFDVNMIYHKQGEGVILNRRIKKQIEAHEKFLEEARDEFQQLISRVESLDAAEEDRLIELDRILEQSVYKVASLPDSIKKGLTFDKKIIDLLESSEKLLKEVKKID